MRRFPLDHRQYMDIYSKVVRSVVEIIAIESHKVLLVKRAIVPFKDKWCFPGGMIFRNETIVEALERVCLSELGQTPLDKEFLTHHEYLSSKENPVHDVSLLFIVKIEREKIVLDGQAGDFSYFSLADMPHDTFQEHREILSAYEERLF